MSIAIGRRYVGKYEGKVLIEKHFYIIGKKYFYERKKDNICVCLQFQFLRICEYLKITSIISVKRYFILQVKDEIYG